MAEAEQSPLQKLLAGNQGWGGLEDAAGADSPEKENEAAMARFEAAHLIAAPFMTPAGRACLEKLKELTVDAPTWPAEGRGGFYDASMFGFAREGQNSIVRHVIAMIDVAERGPPIAQGAGKTKSKTKRNIPTG